MTRKCELCNRSATNVCGQCGMVFCMDCYRHYEYVATSQLCWGCQYEADTEWLQQMPTHGRMTQKRRTWPRNVEEECKANAQLIASAPELLEACEAALSFWERYIDRVRPSDSWAITVRDELRAAVRKARGEGQS